MKKTAETTSKTRIFQSVGLMTVLLAMTACSTVNYRSPTFESQTADHRTVAVMPFEMVFTGKAPAGWTAEQIVQVEEAESVAFQAALYYRLLNRAGKGRIAVTVQPIDETNRRLTEHGIAPRDSWAMPAEELAAIAGCEALIRTTVKKTRYMSDLSSFGIEVGGHLLDSLIREATDGEAFLPVPYGLAKTHDIWADSSLLNGDDGSLLWQVAVHRFTDWSRPANDVIEAVTRRLARKFPYKDPLGS